MRADAHENEPVLFASLGAIGIRGGRTFGQEVVAGAGIGEVGHVDVDGRLDLVLGAVANEYRLAPPQYRDGLAFLDGGEIHFGRC